MLRNGDMNSAIMKLVTFGKGCDEFAFDNQNVSYLRPIDMCIFLT